MAESVGVEFDIIFRSMWDYCVDSRGWSDYDTLTTSKQEQIWSESKERLFVYLLIKTAAALMMRCQTDEYPATSSIASRPATVFNGCFQELLHPDVTLDILVMVIGADKHLPIKVIIVGEIGVVEVLDAVESFGCGVGAVKGMEVEDI